MKKLKTRPGADCGTDHKGLISNIRRKLNKNTKRVVVPKYNLDSIPDEFKGHIRNRFALLDTIDHEPEELWIEIRYFIWEECRKTFPVIKTKEKGGKM